MGPRLRGDDGIKKLIPAYFPALIFNPPCSQRASSRVTFDGGARRGAPTTRAASGAPGGAAPYVIGRVRPEAVTPGNREWPWAHGGSTTPPKGAVAQRPGASRRSIPLIEGTEKGTQADPAPRHHGR